ncbi:helix-turn-helix domain-containing protein [Streptomyces spectabilis]|uniref:DNA-binding transcriptional ArsR family regulator n=1 Tax=Streptomyces spectabilis TaxID=68270 RepID=A0A7W8AQ15_STRST|nr:helix-turn-helix domain-containing protein [Streptomyces spectabilis]MBB5101931.1 DNA-binding transcriptional ArsR family regulator [Streptomyces spectabilis]MCI3906983.1 helix-turn-helix domain-containing protein [Streptomyces spectabilis]
MNISLHRFQRRDTSVLFGPWRRQVAPSLPAATRLLAALSPARGYTCDFLTPRTGEDLAAQTEALRSTPRRRLRTELDTFERVNPGTRLPAWTAELATGSAPLLGRLADTAHAYFDAGLRPYWHTVQDAVRRDVMLRARQLAHGGWAAVLDTLHASARWEYPVLSLDFPVEQELRLAGRGLLLQPSFFCRYGPTALFDPSLEPVLVHPVEHRPGWERPRPGAPALRSLTALLGRARALLLEAAADGTFTTTELARQTGLTPSNASRHLTALREAALVSSRRHRNTTLHTVTALGVSLLDGCRPSLPA